MRYRLRSAIIRWCWGWPDRHDTLPDKWLDRLGAVVDWCRYFIAPPLCWLAGHEPTRDQCLNPEHDYCHWCEKRMPGQA